jgi:hypothetical protein
VRGASIGRWVLPLLVVLLTEWGTLVCSARLCERGARPGLEAYFSEGRLFVTEDHVPRAERLCRPLGEGPARAATWECRPGSEDRPEAASHHP